MRSSQSKVRTKRTFLFLGSPVIFPDSWPADQQFPLGWYNHLKGEDSCLWEERNLLAAIPWYHLSSCHHWLPLSLSATRYFKLYLNRSDTACRERLRFNALLRKNPLTSLYPELYFWEKCRKSTGAEDFYASYFPELSASVYTETPGLHTEAWPPSWIYHHNSVPNLPSVARPQKGQCLFWGHTCRRGGNSKGRFWRFYKAKLMHAVQ